MALTVATRIRNANGSINNTNVLSARLALCRAGVGVIHTGMSAAEFICTSENRRALPQGFGFIGSANLPSLVVVASVMLMALISVDQFFQAMRAPLSTKPQARS